MSRRIEHTRRRSIMSKASSNWYFPLLRLSANPGHVFRKHHCQWQHAARKHRLLCSFRRERFETHALMFMQLRFVHSASERLRVVRNCWQCHKSLNRTENRFFCKPCGVVQPPDEDMDFFELFEQPVSYKLNKPAITKLRNQLQFQLHPDRFHGKSDTERQFSGEQSSLVNNAYNILMDAFKRGDYLLEILGAEKIDENSVQGEVEFLSEIMELNEEIADSSDRPSRLQQLQTNNNSKLTALENEVERAFTANNVAEARLLLCKMKYFLNVSEKLKDSLMHAETK